MTAKEKERAADIPEIVDEHYWEMLDQEPCHTRTSVWHDPDEEPAPDRDLICMGEFYNPLVMSSSSESFKKRKIFKWAYFDDLLILSNMERIGKDWKEEPDKNPRKGLVDLDNVWHSIDLIPHYIEGDTTHNSIAVIGKTPLGTGMSVGTMIDKDKIYAPLTQKEYVWGECPFTKWAYITDLIPESLNKEE